MGSMLPTIYSAIRRSVSERGSSATCAFGFHALFLKERAVELAVALAGCDGEVAGLAGRSLGAEIFRHLVVSLIVGHGKFACRFGKLASVLGHRVWSAVGILLPAVIDGFEGGHLVERALYLVLHLGASHLEHPHKLHLQRCEPLRLSQVGGKLLSVHKRMEDIIWFTIR